MGEGGVRQGSWGSDDLAKLYWPHLTSVRKALPH
jgi:hypothetical protein